MEIVEVNHWTIECIEREGWKRPQKEENQIERVQSHSKSICSTLSTLSWQIGHIELGENCLLRFLLVANAFKQSLHKKCFSLGGAKIDQMNFQNDLFGVVDEDACW